MRVLLIKTSSLGDLIHTFPALTELSRSTRLVRLDWVVERSFAQVPKWHPLVNDVIPVDMRQWFKHPFSPQTWAQWRAFVHRLQRHDYDMVIDAQGLIKSALITRKALGIKHGLDWRSAWEPLASLAYHHRVRVDPSLHAVYRMQHLIAQLFDYRPNCQQTHFGLDIHRLHSDVMLPSQPFVVFAHATTWSTKLWPQEYWQALVRLAGAAGLQVLLPWGNAAEHAAAQSIASAHACAQVLPKLELTDLAVLMSRAQGVVAVDTGLGHIAAAFDVPLVSLYGPTDPAQTGTLGPKSTIIQAQFECAPCEKPICQFKGASELRPACFAAITPERVWQHLQHQCNHREKPDDPIINHHHDIQPA